MNISGLFIKFQCKPLQNLSKITECKIVLSYSLFIVNLILFYVHVNEQSGAPLIKNWRCYFCSRSITTEIFIEKKRKYPYSKVQRLKIWTWFYINEANETHFIHISIKHNLANQNWTLVKYYRKYEYPFCWKISNKLNELNGEHKRIRIYHHQERNVKTNL